MTWRTECVNYLLQLEIPLCRASFLPDPAWPRALRMRSQNEVTELANANPKSVLLQTAHIHMWVEVENWGKPDRLEKLFSPACSWSVMTRQCNNQLLIYFISALYLISWQIYLLGVLSKRIWPTAHISVKLEKTAVTEWPVANVGHTQANSNVSVRRAIMGKVCSMNAQVSLLFRSVYISHRLPCNK